jgi:hypothetical protein
VILVKESQMAVLKNHRVVIVRKGRQGVDAIHGFERDVIVNRMSKNQ